MCVWHNSHRNMARRWTKIEEAEKRAELIKLYVKDNKSLREVAVILGLSEGGVYDRLIRLGIPSLRRNKIRCNNLRQDITIPWRSIKLAEFIGILLGDGNITPTQVTVTLGTKEDEYVAYVVKLMTELFGAQAKVSVNKKGHKTVYIGSTMLVKWLLQMGLVKNKVKMQVDIPDWCYEKKKYLKAVIRGMFDTDGSVYRLKRSNGIQISFTNRSFPLLKSAIFILRKLGYSPSKISCYKVYLTKKRDIKTYCKRIGFANQKHAKRIKIFRHGWIPKWKTEQTVVKCSS